MSRQEQQFWGRLSPDTLLLLHRPGRPIEAHQPFSVLLHRHLHEFLRRVRRRIHPVDEMMPRLAGNHRPLLAPLAEIHRQVAPILVVHLGVFGVRASSQNQSGTWMSRVSLVPSLYVSSM